MSRRGLVVVLAKAPHPGRVKTRMAPPLTLEQAAELYEQLLLDVLAATAALAARLALEPVVAVHPRSACREIARLAPPAFRVIPQRGADLSERMAWAACEAAATGAPRILLRGSDSPTLDAVAVGEALDALESADIVVCPDRDGGYNLVGLRRPAPGLFDHPMSTGSVLDDTLAIARSLGLRARVQAPGFDLDTIEDLRWLAEARERGAAGACSRTLAYLDRHDLWRLCRGQAPEAS